MLTAKVFQSGNSQAIRIPQEMRTDTQDYYITKVGKVFIAYPADDPERCVACLVRRMRSRGEFPHEVGLFLGYPPEDVDGFIRNKARGAKCVGTWKVYGDADAAKKKFERYKKCAEVYGKAYRGGRCFERMVVAEHSASAACAAD